MVNVNDFKVGMTIEYDGNIYSVLDFQHVKPGKGAAIVKAKLKNLRTGSIAEYTFNAGVKVQTARIEKKPMQFLYSMNDTYYFMNMNDYEQIELSKSLIGDDAKLLKENLDVDIIFFEGEMLGMNLPDKIAMRVVHTEPGVKGNTTSTAMKDAELESGLVVKVPMFIDQDEMVLISSKDGKYVSRA
ncbi:MAG: elongation factor P [Bacilli bacterium]|nr:elongation factor P [Bacilli bacterium]